MTTESNLSIPPHPMHKYNWNLGVGDSFFVPGGTVERLSSLATRRAKATGRKFTTRTVKDENGAAIGVRVWRIQ